MTYELLAPEQMGQADALTIARGTPGTVLMERAGQGVADRAMTMAHHPGANILVLCGPGNNGGDGYVAARLLAQADYNVTVVALGDTSRLTGDAASAFHAWQGPTHLDADFRNQVLIIDALFGAGLARPLEGRAAELVDRANKAACPILAVDLPSGVDGRTGDALGSAIEAKHSITFHRLKPGHALYPGRSLCGQVEVVDIGIDPTATVETGYVARITGGYLTTALGMHPPGAHKFAKGHVLVVGGPPEKAGAGFLAANAALRAGAGLTTLAAPQAVLDGSIGLHLSLMRERCDEAADLARLLCNTKLSSCVIGPGLAPDEATRQMVYAALASPVALVLDAGALSAFAGMTDQLFEQIRTRTAPTVLTPHEGEFSRLFGPMDRVLSKLEKAQSAATRSGAVLVLKGADSVIAHPNGEPSCTYINGNAPPWLATAGSGDVLAGIIAGLLAGLQANPENTLDAERLTKTVALGVWLHGRAGQVAGAGLIASDLESGLRGVLGNLNRTPFHLLSVGG